MPARWVAKLASESPKAYAVSLGLLLILSLELSFAIATTGCPMLSAMAWDAGLLLDGGYRLLHGLKPHVDFYSPLGLLPIGLIAAGLKMGTPSVAAYAHIHAVLLPLFAVWAWALLRSRTSAFLAGLLALWIGVLAVAPRALGDPPAAVTYAMQYNRWGWSLLLIASIELFLPKRRGASGLMEAASTGAIAGLLLFLKINYFSAIAAAVVLRMALYRLDRKWIAGAAAAFVAVAGAGFWYLNFDFAAFFGDLRLLASVQTLSSRVGSLVELAAANLFALWALASVLLLAVLYAPGAAAWKERASRLGVPILLAGLGIVTCSANFEKTEIPLISFALFVLAEWLRRHVTGADGRAHAASLAAGLIAIGTIGSTLYLDAATLAGACGVRPGTEAVAWPAFDAAPIRNMRVEAPELASEKAVQAALEAGAVRFTNREQESYPYVLWFNDGARLLREHMPGGAHLLVLDFFNPFQFPLNLTPPRGDALFWHWARNFDGRHYPAAKRVFREVTHVMIPKAPIVRPSTLVLRQIYGGVLDTEYQQVAESRLWTLYERRAEAKTAVAAGM